MAARQVSRELLILGEDLSRPREVVERERLQWAFFGFSLRNEGGLLIARGLFSTKFGNKYLARIEAPERRYPYEIPDVWLPNVKLPLTCPHKFADGSLCVLKPAHWKTLYSFAFMAARTAVWLDKYDSWRRTGIWPGKEPHH